MEPYTIRPPCAGRILVTFPPANVVPESRIKPLSNPSHPLLVTSVGVNAGPGRRVNHKPILNRIVYHIGNFIEQHRFIEKNLIVIPCFKDRPDPLISEPVDTTCNAELKIPHELRHVSVRKSSDEVKMIAQEGKADEVHLMD